jgi:hypothetical protein
MAIKYSDIGHYKTLENLPQIWLFGLKINHLATLHATCEMGGGL